MNRLIAIGDIHGEYDKLNSLLAKLNFDNTDTFIFLGDYIDRGLKSKQVVDKLLELSQICHCEFLKGNHEYFLLCALKGDKAAEHFFLSYGGVETMESYGSFENIFKLHGDFYNNLKLTYKTDNYIFVHGGINPFRSLDSQDEFEMLMIRDEFINYPTKLKEKVIFGHTPFKTPFVAKDKIGIDTGAGKYKDAFITAYICNENQFIFSDI